MNPHPNYQQIVPLMVPKMATFAKFLEANECSENLSQGLGKRFGMMAWEADPQGSGLKKWSLDNWSPAMLLSMGNLPRELK